MWEQGDKKKLSTKELTPLKCGAGEDSWESLGQQEDQTNWLQRELTLNIHWKDWCWSWSSNTLATWWEELTHWKRPWELEGTRKIKEFVRAWNPSVYILKRQAMLLTLAGDKGLIVNESISLMRPKRKVTTSRNMQMEQREKRKCRTSTLNSSTLMVRNQQI